MKELAVIVIKTKDNILSYPTVETVQENSICKLVYVPARNVSDTVKRNAQDLARQAVGCLKEKESSQSKCSFYVTHTPHM